MSNAREKGSSNASFMMGASLTQGSIANALTGMALPMATGILATMSFNIVDTFFVSQLGADALAAISFTFPIVMIAISIGVGLGAGISSVVGRAAGSDDRDAVKILTTDGMTLTLLVCISLSTLGFFTIDPLFRSLGATEVLLPLVRDYMVPWYISMTFFIAPMVGLASIRALGNTKLQGKLMVSMAIGNAILDPFLIYGWWIFPRLEIQGAAIASLCVRLVALFVTFYFMHIRMQLFVNPFNVSRVLASWKRILHVGIPAMATNLIVPISSSLVLALIAFHGATAVAGFGVATRVEAVALILFYALSSVIGPFCGQNLGAGKFHRLAEAQRLSARFCIIAGIVVALLLAIFGRSVAGLFSDDLAVINTTTRYLQIVPLSYCAYGIVMFVNASFNGLGKPMPGVVISVARVVVVLLPLAWLGSRMWGVSGIFAAMAVANIVVGVGAYHWVNTTIAQAQRQSLS